MRGFAGSGGSLTILEPFFRCAAIRSHIAWLGESGRMGWWETDALDPDGGGAMLATIFRRTARWAGIQIAWACASVAEAELVKVTDAITLFRLTPAVDARLMDWLRRQKHGADAPDSLLPAAADSSTPADAFAGWSLIGSDAIGSARAKAPASGVRALSLGTIARSDLGNLDAVGTAAERLAAGYIHSGRNRAVVPFIELR
jgi:hypothetical protein